MPTEFNVALLEHAHEDGAVYGSKAVGEPPLMLAFSVREALREACAAFGPPGVSVELASPATPEAVYWALDRVRSGGAGMTTWWQAVADLRASREAGVLVTVTDVRGHAPRDAGREDGRRRAPYLGLGRRRQPRGRGRTPRASAPGGRRRPSPESFESHLSDKVPLQHGVQCCGGEVAVLLEPLPVVPSVAIFGVGHVGLELARILARHDLDLHLVDSRAEHLSDEALRPLEDAVAAVHVHPVPVLPELVLTELPPGTHLLVMTHDHAEDVALCDAAIRLDHLGPIGLIGSSAKLARFRSQLLADGHDPTVVDRIRTPIGLPGVTTSKQPAAIAVSVAAELLAAFELEGAAETKQRR